MLPSEAKSVVLANIERLRDDLRLWDWHLEITYGRLDDASATCQIHPAYQRATITLDPEQLDDEQDVLRALRHELIHVFCWPMHAYGLHTEELTDGKTVDANWTFYLERMVWSVERLLDLHEVPLEVADDN